MKKKTQSKMNILAILGISFLTSASYWILSLVLHRATNGWYQVLGGALIMTICAVILRDIKQFSIPLAAAATPIIYNLIVAPAAFIAAMPLPLLDALIWFILAVVAGYLYMLLIIAGILSLIPVKNKR